MLNSGKAKCVLLIQTMVVFILRSHATVTTRNEMHIVARCGLDSVEGTFFPESRKKESVGGAGIVVFSFYVPSAYL